MASVNFQSPIDRMSGKARTADNGYFYTSPSGKRCFRTRTEDYQQNQSHRQMWNSAAFAAAQAELKLLYQEPNTVQTIRSEWAHAKKRNPETGRVYATARGWKISMLQSAWRQANPFESWLDAYLTSVRETAAAKTEAADLRPSTIEKEIALLQSQIQSLRSQLPKK